MHSLIKNKVRACDCIHIDVCLSVYVYMCVCACVYMCVYIDVCVLKISVHSSIKNKVRACTCMYKLYVYVGRFKTRVRAYA